MYHSDIRIAEKYLSKKHSAKARGIEFTISFQSFKNLMRAKRCYYSGVTLVAGGKDNTVVPNTLTIDRVDSSKGYVKGNVVACSHRMNDLKNMAESRGMTFKEFIKYMQRFDKEMDKRS